MARFSVCGGNDGEGSSANQSRKRQRLPSIDEDEENSEELPFIDRDEENAEEDSDAGSSGEEDEEDDRRETRIEYRGYASDDSDPDVVLEEIIRFADPVNSESSSIQDSSLSITLLDPDVLDCPICCEPLKVPIFQCDNGHLACSVCCTKVRNICPSCTLPIGYNRCRAMEKVIEASRVSCPNAKYGCNEKMPYGNRFSHEELCVFAPCPCPVLNCNYTGYYKDLNSHVGAKHKDDVIPFAWNVSVNISFDLDNKTTVLQEKNDGDVIVVQAFRGLHVVYVAVSCIAPSVPGVEKLSCFLVNVTVNSTLKQGFMVKNIQKVRSELPEDGFMVIPSYMLSGTLPILIRRGRGYVNA